MALTLGAVYDVALELTDGNKRPNVKLALWAVALSPNKQLAWNAAQVEALRPYVKRDLPGSMPEVWALIRSGHPFASRADAENIRNIEALDKSGELRGLGRKPRTAREWDQWRRRVAAIKGLSWKTASFAALLLWPFDCPFVPVDTHVLTRLGLEYFKEKVSDKNEPGYARYKAVEWLVKQERDHHAPRVPLGIWHWLKWSEWRQATGDEAVSDTPESHAGLSPYRY